ncbi:MAG: hypothetical protein OQJ96_04755 [Flavobacteriales bacterium]|nr:hypothetical protein [Flavobacteriales bacterium]MCW8913630.1 hypothetical protein [Flavobacteriales bacterium]MCW8937134.1 hypothetical protein [Flavobacteriales bacterium]MCW8941192.1 hypothetical protein [Flavobacteriales bacterium]MCW8968533.1 hypothetical protein [Flavobacteriales bacterium]
MLKNIALIILATISFISLFSCGEDNTNEIGHVDGLIKILDSSEEVLHNVDTTTLFEINIFVKQSIEKIQSKNDTLIKEAALEADQYINKLKTLYDLSKNYKKYQIEIDIIRTQLNNLKQDLNNGLISKKQFPAYYEIEQAGVIGINDKITHATNGMSNRLDKMKENKAAFEKLINDPKSYTSYYK